MKSINANKDEYCMLCNHLGRAICSHCDINNVHQFGDRTTLPDEGYTNFFERRSEMNVWLKNHRTLQNISPIVTDIWRRLFYLSECEKRKLNNIIITKTKGEPKMVETSEVIV